VTAEAQFFPRARLDLVEQASYLAENASLETAERFLDAAERTVARLAGMPRMGRVWEGQHPLTRNRIRVWKVEGYPKILIFYRPEDQGISVVRVLHSARDLPPLLEGYV
jgi:plasmid stabilization system protein ParE